jgi:cell division protein FtsQ
MRKIKHKRPDLPKVSFLKRSSSFTLRIFLKPAVFSTIGIFALASWFYISGEFHASIAATKRFGHKVSAHFDLVLKDVYLEGQNYTSKEQILEALDIKIGQPLLSIDLWDIKESIEKLSWVQYAIVERLYPSTLSIHIVERQPVAFWQNKGKIHLIDEQGEVIKEQDFKRFSNLIILVGEDVSLHAKPLLHMFYNDPVLKEQVSAAVRVGGRRWDIKLHNGVVVNLPEERAENAWKYLAQLHEEKAILNQVNHYIDLRIEGKMFIK